MVSGQLEGQGALPWMHEGVANHWTPKHHVAWWVIVNRVQAQVLTMVANVFCAVWFSVCSRMRELIKKWAMQWHFLVLPPCHCIAKIGNNFVWEMSRFGEDGWFGFFGDGKRAEWCQAKSVIAQLESTKKGDMHINFFTYSRTYQCTPYL